MADERGALADVVYRVPGGELAIDYVKSRVVEIDTNSAYYRTHGGIGVGSTIPLPPCTYVNGKCSHLWNGMTLGHDVETGAQVWHRRGTFGGRIYDVELEMNGSKVDFIKMSRS